MSNSYYLAKARRCRELADSFKDSDPKTMAVCLATARTWESMAGGGPGWSLKPLRQQLEQLKHDAAGDPPATKPKAAPEPLAVVGPGYRQMSRQEARKAVSQSSFGSGTYRVPVDIEF